MSEYNPVSWFEIPVTDLDRAEKFYETLLGVKLDRQSEVEGMTMSWFPMFMEAPGAAGSLVLHESYKPAQGAGTVVYFSAPDFDDALARVEEAGGKVLYPKKDIGEYGFIAGVQDSEGNSIALHTDKEKE